MPENRVFNLPDSRQRPKKRQDWKTNGSTKDKIEAESDQHLPVDQLLLISTGTRRHRWLFPISETGLFVGEKMFVIGWRWKTKIFGFRRAGLQDCFQTDSNFR